MRLSWNEVRARAAAFAEEWCNAARETSETQSFYNAFFRVFGVERRSVARYEEHFGFILGVQKRAFRDQDPANIKAAELVGRLHDKLDAAGYRGHDLERFLVRIVFCLFADDTGIFEPRDIFLEFVETRTSEDGADLGPWLRQLFEVLNSPEEERSPLLDEDLARFPYVNGDALEKDWSELLPPEDCSFVFGNPPFVGTKYQTPEQRAQVRRIAAFGKSGGTLDYVTAWFIKAGEYVQEGPARIGFVATNSITQGEQVAQLWPILFDRCKLEIAFAHRTFAWGSDARGKAHVHVAILGLDKRDRSGAEKRLFSYPDIQGEPEESRHKALSPYLFEAAGLTDPHLTVRGESRPINGMPKLIIGSKPIDRGHYIFNAIEKESPGKLQKYLFIYCKSIPKNTVKISL